MTRSGQRDWRGWASASARSRREVIESLRRMCETCHSTDLTLTPELDGDLAVALAEHDQRRDAALGGAELAQAAGELAVGCLAEPLEQPADAAEQRRELLLPGVLLRGAEQVDGSGGLGRLQQQQPARQVGADLCLEPCGAGADRAGRGPRRAARRAGRSERPRPACAARRRRSTASPATRASASSSSTSLTAVATSPRAASDPGQPAAPGQPRAVVGGGELLAGALEVGHRLLDLSPRRGELAETEAGARGHGSAHADQRGQLA